MGGIGWPPPSVKPVVLCFASSFLFNDHQLSAVLDAFPGQAECDELTKHQKRHVDVLCACVH